MRSELRTLVRSWPRYLAEILVIMGSILAAFALDNWNDDRSRRREEIAILGSALNELQSDLADIDYNVRHHEQAIRSMDLVLDRLESDVAWHDSLAAHFHNALIMPRFVHSTSAYETMQSRGVDIVSDEELRNRLIRLHGAHYANYLTAETEQANEINHGLRSIMPGRFREGFNYEEVGQTYNGTMVPTDFEALKRDREYLYYLRTLRNRTDVFVNFFYRNLRSAVERAHSHVEQELDRLTR